MNSDEVKALTDFLTMPPDSCGIFEDVSVRLSGMFAQVTFTGCGLTPNGLRGLADAMDAVKEGDLVLSCNESNPEGWRYVFVSTEDMMLQQRQAQLDKREHDDSIFSRLMSAIAAVDPSVELLDDDDDDEEIDDD